MFSFLLLIIALTPQGNVSNVQIQGSYAEVQSNVIERQVQTDELSVVNSHGQAGGLRVEPVHNLTLTNTVAH